MQHNMQHHFKRSLLALPTLNEIKQAYEIMLKKELTSQLISIKEGLFVKAECNLPTGSYKIRGLEYLFEHHDLENPVKVLSAGNLALAAAHTLKNTNIDCVAVVPEGISSIKRTRIENLGAKIEEKPFEKLWNLVLDNNLRQSKQVIHPFNAKLLAGYATIILELLDAKLPPSILVVPYGLGGLAAALTHAIDITNADIELVVAEIAGNAPFERARIANKPMVGAKLTSFIEAMGTPTVIGDIFEYLNDKVLNVITVTEQDVKHEIALTYKTHHLKLEGAAGASLAAAKKIVSKKPIISLATGANISDDIFNSILGE